MEMEQGLYAQVVKLCRKDLEFIATDKNKNEAKFKFQGQLEISQRWFDLDFDWTDVNFSTPEPDFYKKLFQSHDNTNDTNTYKRCQVTIGNAKYVELFKFQNDAPILKYCQKSLNICRFSTLESAFASINHKKASNDISLRIEEYLECEQGNRIDFANAILKIEKKPKGEPRVYYSPGKYKQKGSYDILTDISEDFTLVQLMDSLGNVNHAISFVGYWIFDSNYKKALVLNMESLGIICAPYFGEEQAANFETVFYAVRYIRFDAQLNKELL